MEFQLKSHCFLQNIDNSVLGMESTIESLPSAFPTKLLWVICLVQAPGLAYHRASFLCSR